VTLGRGKLLCLGGPTLSLELKSGCKKTGLGISSVLEHLINTEEKAFFLISELWK
jgi:hypothetical protein